MLPEGVNTRGIEVGPAFDQTFGTPYTIKVMVSASRNLVWNGTPVQIKAKLYTVKPGETAVIDLPVTNQSGYRDTKGNLISLSSGEYSHYYDITVSYQIGSSVASKKKLQVILPSGPSPVDLDDLIQFNSAKAGKTISAPDEWTAMIATAQAAATAAATAANAVSENIENLEGLVGDSVQQWFDDHSGTVVSPQVLDAKLDAHKNESTPHKAYDLDIPSLTVLFENGLA